MSEPFCSNVSDRVVLLSIFFRCIISYLNSTKICTSIVHQVIVLRPVFHRRNWVSSPLVNCIVSLSLHFSLVASRDVAHPPPPSPLFKFFFNPVTNCFEMPAYFVRGQFSFWFQQWTHDTLSFLIVFWIQVTKSHKPERKTGMWRFHHPSSQFVSVRDAFFLPAC